MTSASFEELFNLTVLDVIIPIATTGLPTPSQDDPYIDDVWLEALEEEATDRKLAFFDENLDFFLILRVEYPTVEEGDDKPKTPPINLLAFLAHLQVTYDASYIASLPSDAPIVPNRTHSMNRAQAGQTKASTLGAAHPSIFPPHTPNPVPSSTDSDRQYSQTQGTPLRAGVWGDGMAGDNISEGFALLWSASDSCWIVVFKMTVQVSFMPTKVPDPLLCLTASVTLREKPIAVTAARKPLQALIEAAGGLPGPVFSSEPAKLNGEDDEFESVDITGLHEVNLLEGLAAGPTFSSSGAPLILPTSRLGASIRKDVFSLPDLTAEPETPMTTSSSTTLGRTGTLHGTHATMRKSFRKTLRTISGFRVRMRTVFVPYFMLPENGSSSQKSRKYQRRKSALKVGAEEDDDTGTESDDAELVHERELREAGNEENTVILCVEVENAQESTTTLTSPLGFSVESVNVTVSGEGAQTRLITWGDKPLSASEQVFPLFLGPSEQYNLLYAVSFLRSPESDDQFSLARGKGLPGAPGSATQELQRAVGIIINGRPYEIPSDLDLKSSTSKEEAIQARAKELVYPTPTFPSRWNCVLDLSSNAIAPSIVGHGTDATSSQGKKEVLPTPASPFPSSGPRASFIGPTGSAGGRSNSPYTTGPKPGTATPTMIAGSKRHTLSAMDAEMYAGGGDLRTKPPPSPINYRSSTAMLNPTNLRDGHLQTGTQPNIINAAAAAAQAQMMNPILGPNSASMRASYLPPSVSVYGKSPTTYGPLSPPLPPTPGGGMSFAGAMTQFQPQHGADDSISSFISSDISSTFAVPPTPAYPAYPTSPPPRVTSPTGRQQKYWQAPVGGGLQGGASVGPAVEIRREKALGAGIPQTPGPRVGPGIGTGTAIPGQIGFAQMQNEVLGGGIQGGEGEPIVVSVGLLPTPGRPAGRIYPLDQFTLDIFVFNQSSWTRRFEVSYPDRRKKRREQANLNATMGIADLKGSGDAEVVGVVPLVNRVRIGPLLPSTCQSVRMDFLALSPGVHAIDTLTLSDIQSGYSIDLRSVIDIVVHEHAIPSDKPSSVRPLVVEVA
ncbi:TRAPP trafficking subunit Trs65-domain-containing protein [Cristinia sonorae]|uniref:TRAPP trafficking subunit Trs65-domain-containing protein n=1 Tax=Cristinia sonorae TaxID=1940300 RepID=A0A8K0UYX6_9AGAR|nr:TRAPP trafficking subunit Trs65-domain-containing protein [Cristinia sonorae]